MSFAADFAGKFRKFHNQRRYWARLSDDSEAEFRLKLRSCELLGNVKMKV
jgi:hypothetical protein